MNPTGRGIIITRARNKGKYDATTMKKNIVDEYKGIIFLGHPCPNISLVGVFSLTNSPTSQCYVTVAYRRCVAVNLPWVTSVPEISG